MLYASQVGRSPGTVNGLRLDLYLDLRAVCLLVCEAESSAESWLGRRHTCNRASRTFPSKGNCQRSRIGAATVCICGHASGARAVEKKNAVQQHSIAAARLCNLVSAWRSSQATHVL
jgi:hypothetical protein